MIEPLALGRVEHRFLDDAKDGFGPEIIFVVELVDHLQHVFAWQARILNLRQLVAAIIHHALVANDEAVLFGKVIELCARISMGDGDLNGLNIELLGKINSVANGLAGFTREAKNKVSMHYQ